MRCQPLLGTYKERDVLAKLLFCKRYSVGDEVPSFPYSSPQYLSPVYFPKMWVVLEDLVWEGSSVLLPVGSLGDRPMLKTCHVISTSLGGNSM